MTLYNEAAFNRKADKYEQRWNKYLKHTHNLFLNKIETTKDDILLDASCGTGLLATEIIENGMPFQELVLNDPSGAMLNLARKRLEEHSEVTFSNFTAEIMAFEDSSFDGILCLNAFHFYTNHDKVLENFSRILKPEGRLYILDWNRSGFFRLVNRIIKWSTPENINTRSLVEMHDMLKDCGLQIAEQEEWYRSYWKFFFLDARK